MITKYNLFTVNKCSFLHQKVSCVKNTRLLVMHYIVKKYHFCLFTTFLLGQNPISGLKEILFKEIVDRRTDGRWKTDNGPSQKLTLSTLCSGELKRLYLTIILEEVTQNTIFFLLGLINHLTIEK